MWLSGFGVDMASTARLLPHLHASLHGPGGWWLHTHLLPAELYQLPSPPAGWWAELRRHQAWCLLHRGVVSRACWHAVDRAPLRFFGALLHRQGNGTVRPLALPDPCSTLHFRLRWNACLGEADAEHIRFHWREALPRRVVDPHTGHAHCRFYPGERWLPVRWPLEELHFFRSPKGRWAGCEGVL